MPPEAQPPNAELPPVPPQQQRQPQDDPELARLRGEVAKHRETINALQQKVMAPAQPNQPAQPSASKTDLNKMFYQDPVQNSVDIARHVAQDVLRQSVEGAQDTLITVAKNEARGQDPVGQKIFDKYAAEIEAAAMSADPRFRANVTVWKNAVSYVKGQHMQEIMQEFYQQQPPTDPNRAPAVHIKQGDGPGAPSARPGQASKSAELSAEEKRVAHKLGLTEDQYKAGKAHVEGQNDSVTDPVGRSSWDQHITFSTKELRRKQRDAQKGRAA